MILKEYFIMNIYVICKNVTSFIDKSTYLYVYIDIYWVE